MSRSILHLLLWFLAGYGAAAMLGLIGAIITGFVLIALASIQQKSTNVNTL